MVESVRRHFAENFEEGLTPRQRHLCEAAVGRGDGEPREVAAFPSSVQLHLAHCGGLNHRDVVVGAPEVHDLQLGKPHCPLDTVVCQVPLLVTDARHAELRHTLDRLALGLCEVDPGVHVDLIRRHQTSLEKRCDDQAYERSDIDAPQDKRQGEARCLERVVLARGVDHDQLELGRLPAVLRLQHNGEVGCEPATERRANDHDRAIALGRVIWRSMSNRLSRAVQDTIGHEPPEAVADEQPSCDVSKHCALDLGDTLVSVEQDTGKVHHEPSGFGSLTRLERLAECRLVAADEPPADRGVKEDQHDECSHQNAKAVKKPLRHRNHIQSYCVEMTESTSSCKELQVFNTIFFYFFQVNRLVLYCNRYGNTKRFSR